MTGDKARKRPRWDTRPGAKFQKYKHGTTEPAIEQPGSLTGALERDNAMDRKKWKSENPQAFFTPGSALPTEKWRLYILILKGGVRNEYF